MYFVLFRLFFSFNRRAKEKRLKKDAGRTRWSQYFRSMKGGSSPRLDKLLDKDELKVDLDSFSHGKFNFYSCYMFYNSSVRRHISNRSDKEVFFPRVYLSDNSGSMSLSNNYFALNVFGTRNISKSSRSITILKRVVC